MSLADLESIRQLKARYFRYVDTKQWDRWAELFTDVATLKAGFASTDVTARDLERLVAWVKRQLAKPRQHLGAKKILQGARGLFGRIDLSLPQALLQLRHGKIDDDHGVGVADDAVGHAFADLDPGRGSHDILHALEMLHVDGGYHSQGAPLLEVREVARR